MIPYLKIVLFLVIINDGLKCDAQSNHKIIEGVPVSISRIPYQVSVEYFGRHLCGGSIIHGQIIITAAHCVFKIEPSNISVRAGSSDITKGGIIVRVCSLVVHSDYNDSTYDNDVAILKLCRKLPPTNSISTVALASSAEIVRTGAVGTISGWGRTSEDGNISSVLRQAKVTFVSQQRCKRLYSSLVLTNNMLCAGSLLGGTDSCQGDSGGPLVYRNKLVGIVSWGYGCGRPFSPGVYTRVSAVRCWIKMLVGI